MKQEEEITEKDIVKDRREKIIMGGKKVVGVTVVWVFGNIRERISQGMWEGRSKRERGKRREVNIGCRGEIGKGRRG